MIRIEKLSPSRVNIGFSVRITVPLLKYVISILKDENISTENKTQEYELRNVAVVILKYYVREKGMER